MALLLEVPFPPARQQRRDVGVFGGHSQIFQKPRQPRPLVACEFYGIRVCRVVHLVRCDGDAGLLAQVAQDVVARSIRVAVVEKLQRRIGGVQSLEQHHGRLAGKAAPDEQYAGL